VPHKEKGWVIWCKANPNDKGVQASSRVGARNLNVIKIAEKKQLEDSMSQEPEVGENVKMCQHVLPKPTLNAGCIKISSWTIIRHIKV
jgi:hypothetical protein